MGISNHYRLIGLNSCLDIVARKIKPTDKKHVPRKDPGWRASCWNRTIGGALGPTFLSVLTKQTMKT